MIEYRCQAPHLTFIGEKCRRLLFRYSSGSSGTWEVRCTNCGRFQIIEIAGERRLVTVGR